MFNTQDSFDEIVELLEYVTDRSIDKIKLWTPHQKRRFNPPERSVDFHYYDEDFHVFGANPPIDVIGVSRGVKVEYKI